MQLNEQIQWLCRAADDVKLQEAEEHLIREIERMQEAVLDMQGALEVISKEIYRRRRIWT